MKAAGNVKPLTIPAILFLHSILLSNRIYYFNSSTSDWQIFPHLLFYTLLTNQHFILDIPWGIIMIDRFELFTTTITQIYKNLQRIKMQEMSGFELRGTYVMCMFELNRNPEGLTITQLSQLCGEDKAAISRTISELVKRGLVTGNNDKKYRAPLVLTKEGQETAAKIDALASTAVAAGSNGLTPEEVKIFYKALTTISDNLNNYLVDTPDN